MIILGIVLSVFAIGFFCWILFALAVYALPCFVGMSAAFAAYHHGCGVFESTVIGVVAGALTLVIGQILFARLRIPVVRFFIALVFAIPAAVAGYHAMLGIAHIALPHDLLSTTLAYIGALLVGATAWLRMTSVLPPTGPDISDGVAAPQLSSPARN